MPATFEDLPNELLRDICLHLVADGVRSKQQPWQWEQNPGALKARRALSSLSQTCSIMRDIGQPELFRGFSELPDRKLLLLLAVLRKPKLARFVERLNLNDAGDKVFIYDDPSYHPSVIQFKDTPIEAAVRGLAIGFADEWVEHFRHDENFRHPPVITWDAILALYLAFFPAIKEILFYWPGEHAAIVKKLLAEASRLIPSWHKLQKLHIEGFVEEMGWNSNLELNEATGILAWPALRMLTIKDLKITGMLDPRYLPSPSVTHLVLSWNVITSAAHKALLSAPRALEDFTFWDATPDFDESTTERVAPRAVVNHLKAHASSLLSLHLDYSDLNWDEYQSFLQTGEAFHIASLKRFTSLKKLDIDAECIHVSTMSPGSTLLDFLPSSICDLELFNVNDDTFASMLMPLALNLGDFPQLKKVKIRIHNHRSYHWDYDELEPVFTERGVSYILLWANVPPRPWELVNQPQNRV